MAATLGQLVVQLAADTARFEGDLGRAAAVAEANFKNIKNSAEKFLGAIAIVAASAGGALLDQFRRGIEQTEEIEKFSKSVGLTTAEFSRLQFAAEASHVTVEEFRTGLRNYERQIGAAAGGNEKAIRLFEALGISLKDASGQSKTLGQLFYELADRMASYEDSPQKVALALLAMGRAGNTMLPMLDQSAAGIETLAQKADEFGVTIGDEAAQKVGVFHTAMVNLTQGVLPAFQRKLAAEMAVPFAKFIQQFTDAASGAGRLDNAVRIASEGIKVMLSGIGVLIGAVKTLGDLWGAWAASLVALSQGEFRRAWEVLKMGFGDVVGNIKGTAKTITGLWDESASQVAAQAPEIGEKLAAPIVESTKRVLTWREELGNELAKLQGHVGTETQALTARIANEVNRNFERTGHYEQQFFLRYWEQLQEIGSWGAQSIQQAWGEFFFDPIGKGLDGLLKDFTIILRRMVAEATAADLMKRLFGFTPTGESGLSALFGSALSWMFGGGSAGTAPVVGGGGGSAGGGGFGAGPNAVLHSMTRGRAAAMVFAPTYNVDARGADAERIMTMLPPMLAETADRARRQVYDEFRRSGLPAPRLR